jgi:hypothetical protein
MRNLSKNSLIKFDKAVRKIINRFGGVPSFLSFSHRENFEFETKVGKFTVSLFEREETCIYSIFGIFENEKRASKLLVSAVNSHSGKCNFHGTNYEQVLNDFENLLDIVMSKKNIPISDFKALQSRLGKTYDDSTLYLPRESKQVIEGRASIDDCKIWEWKSGLALVIGGACFRITSKDVFHLKVGKLNK